MAERADAERMMMTAAEVTELIEQTISTLPERMSGNEGNFYVAEKLRSLIPTDRKSVIEALKAYLAFRVPPERRQPQDAVVSLGAVVITGLQ